MTDKEKADLDKIKEKADLDKIIAALVKNLKILESNIKKLDRTLAMTNRKMVNLENKINHVASGTRETLQKVAEIDARTHRRYRP